MRATLTLFALLMILLTYNIKYAHEFIIAHGYFNLYVTIVLTSNVIEIHIRRISFTESQGKLEMYIERVSKIHSRFSLDIRIYSCINNLIV